MKTAVEWTWLGDVTDEGIGAQYFSSGELKASLRQTGKVGFAWTNYAQGKPVSSYEISGSVQRAKQIVEAAYGQSQSPDRAKIPTPEQNTLRLKASERMRARLADDPRLRPNRQPSKTHDNGPDR